MPRCPPESAGFEHRGEADGLRRRRGVAHRARGGELRLRHALLGEAPPHRDLVRHRVRDVGADARQAERLRDRGDDRHGAVGGDRQRAVDAVPPRDLDHAVHVLEVDDLADVGGLEAERGAVPVDGDDAEPELLRAPDRAALVAARADEEDGLSAHPRRCYCAGAIASCSSADQRLDVGLVAAGDAKGDAVQEARREPADVDDVDVLPELPARLRVARARP